MACYNADGSNSFGDFTLTPDGIFLGDTDKPMLRRCDGDPGAGGGTSANSSSLFLGAGSAWLKTGPSDTDWSEISTA